MQHFNPSTVEFSQGRVAGDPLYSQKGNVNKVQGNNEPRYLPENIPLPTPTVSDDRMGDIDWVRVLLIHLGFNLILSIQV